MFEREKAWLLREKWGGISSPGFLLDSKRLEQGEPLAYVIGFIPFLNAKIYLDSRPLIPRPETEYWVERAIEEVKHMPAPRILDLCAGSGCIGVSVLVARKDAMVDFEEIDTAHHATIRKNILENHIDEARTRILGGDLFEMLTDTYDCILSNPPYIAKDHDRSAENVRMYEPRRALYGGSDGLEVIERIIEGANRMLREHGVLYLEHEPEHTRKIAARAQAFGFTAHTYPDQFTNERFTRLSRAMPKSVTK